MTDFANLTMTRQNFDAGLYESWADWCNANGYEIAENDAGYFCRKYEPQPLDYREKRQMAYPDIGEQLDVIYWDKVNGTNLWAEAVQAVKREYPKE